MTKRPEKTYGAHKTVRLMMAHLFESLRLGVSDHTIEETKTLIRMLEQIAGVLRLEKDAEIERRIEALEEKFNG
jgi:phage portal protein BeeE